jgi:hypothetical protein
VKINKTFVSERADDWERIRASHQAFNKDRWRWRELVRRTRVSAAAKDVALSLVDKFGGGGDGRIYPSHAAISADTGLDERTVRAAVAKLHDAGLIVTMSRGSTSTLYFFADPTDTFVTVREDGAPSANGHGGDSLTGTNVTVRESQTCQSDRHDRDGNHDQGTRPPNMTNEHGSERGAFAPAEQTLRAMRSESCEPAVREVEAREQEIDLVIEEAIRDADDTELFTLRGEDIRKGFARRYGDSIEHKWWIVSDWWNGDIEWIDAISELEKGEEEDGQEEVRHAHG